MWKLSVFLFTISAFFVMSNCMSTCGSNCTCKEQGCSQEFSFVFRKISDSEVPTCRELEDYIACLDPCEDAVPGEALHAMYGRLCTNSTIYSVESPHIASTYLNVFSMFTSGSPPNIDPSALQLLENCTALARCIPKDTTVLSSDNVTAVCGIVQSMFECLNNASTYCTIPEQVSSLMATARQRLESLCSTGTIQLQLDMVIESMLVGLFNNSGMSVSEINQMLACGVLTDCSKSVTVVTADVYGGMPPTRELCQIMVPLYQCVNEKMKLDQCGTSEEVKSTFAQMTGYIALACMEASSSNESSSSSDAHQVFVRMLKGDGGLSLFNSPGCEALFRCASDAESDMMQAIDDGTYCSNLQATNMCIDDNKDSCAMASHFQEIIDQAREEEFENCPNGAACQPTYVMGMLFGLSSVVVIYLLKL